MANPERAEPQRAEPVPAESDRGPADAMQDAALQMIAAARTFLAAAEDVVRDPSAVRDMAGTVTSMARSFLRTVVPTDAGRRGAGRSGDDADPTIEHIDVS